MKKINDMGKQQGTICIDLSKPENHYTKITLATNLAIVFTNMPLAGHSMQWIIEFCQDGEGGKTITFPASLRTIPRINMEPNAISAITFYMEDGNNIEAQNQAENKIEIKEEDFDIVNKDEPDHGIRYLYLHTHRTTGSFSQKACEQLKQQILENQKLCQEIKELQLLRLTGKGSFAKIKFKGLKDECFDVEQTEDFADWNVNWLTVTLQELWSKPTIQKILKETFRNKK